MATLQDLRDIGYSILREEEGTTAYPLVLMDLLLNSAQNRICNGNLINPITKESIRKGQLSFLGTSAFFSNVDVTTTTANVAVSAVTINVTSTTNFGSTGVLYINGNIITYTGKTATSFTGCANILFAHISGSQVSIAFTLPTEYGSILNITYNNSYKLDAKLYDDIWEDLNSNKNAGYNRIDSGGFRSQTDAKPFYTIIDGTYFVIFNRNKTGDQIHLRYEKIATTMVASSDQGTIPDSYVKSTVPYLAIGEMLYQRGEEGRASEILNFAMGQVKEMYSHYNDRSFESINGTQYKMGKGKLNI